MERRKFMQHSVLAGASLLTANTLFARSLKTGERNIDSSQAEKPFNLNYAFHDGMFANHGGKNFVDQIKFAYDMGFRSIEDNGVMGRTPELQKEIGNTLARLGMTMGVFVVTSNSWHWKTSLASGKQEWIDLMKKDCKEAVEVAKRC